MAWFNFFNRKSTTISRLMDLSFDGGATAAGESVTPDSAMRQATAYACVRVLAESVAQLPLIVYERTKEGRQRAVNHPLYDLLHNQPNSWQTAFEFRDMMMTHLVLRGNAYAYVNRVRGQVRELVPIHPDRVTVKQFSDYSLQYTIRPDSGDAIVLRQDQVLHLRGLTLDGVVGVSPVTYHRETIGLAVAAEKFGSRHFGNGARPGGVLASPTPLKPETAELMRDRWQAAYGSGNQHKVAVLDGGLEFKPISMSAEDSQYLETRQFQRSEICAIFRVPPHKVGDLSRATFSNIEHQSMEFVRDSLMPWLVRWEQVIARDGMTRQERQKYFVEHLVAGLLRGDQKTRTETYARQIQWGILSPNEARAMENMNPREGGDAFLTPLNMLVDGKDVAANAE